MNAEGRVFALLPAAGKSRRMGTPKLALPLGARTILERVIDALRAAGVEEILVVLGPQVADLQRLARAAGAQALVLDRETPDMRATVERGVDWLERERRPRPEDFLLLAPADHPTLDAKVVRGLIEAAAAHPQASLFVPTHAGRRGHPLLIAWSHVPGIRALPADQGINVYLGQHRSATCEVQVLTPEILRDLDTPADYERLRADYDA